jgi:hypothetical protein
MGATRHELTAPRTPPYEHRPTNTNPPTPTHQPSQPHLMQPRRSRLYLLHVAQPSSCSARFGHVGKCRRRRRRRRWWRRVPRVACPCATRMVARYLADGSMPSRYWMHQYEGASVCVCAFLRRERNTLIDHSGGSSDRGSHRRRRAPAVCRERARQ